MDICLLMAPVTKTQWHMSASCCSVDPFTLPCSHTVGDRRSVCQTMPQEVSDSAWAGLRGVQEQCLLASLSHATLFLMLVPLQSFDKGSYNAVPGLLAGSHLQKLSEQLPGHDRLFTHITLA